MLALANVHPYNPPTGLICAALNCHAAKDLRECSQKRASVHGEPGGKNRPPAVRESSFPNE